MKLGGWVRQWKDILGVYRGLIKVAVAVAICVSDGGTVSAVGAAVVVVDRRRPKYASAVFAVLVAAQVGLDLLEKGELSEEEFSGLVKAEEEFQKVTRRSVPAHAQTSREPHVCVVSLFASEVVYIRIAESMRRLRRLRRSRCWVNWL